MKINFTDQNFEEQVLKNNLAVLVDFRADWCGPCKLLDPLLEELATEYDGKIVMGSLDVDANQQTAMKYAVMSIPTVLIFKNGSVVKQMVGYQGKEKLVAEINSVVS